MTLTDLMSRLPDDRIITPDDLALVGLSRHLLSRAVRDGTLIRLRRGAYIPAAHWRPLRRADRHRLLVTATVPRCGPVLLSHESAAVMWDIPLLGPVPATVHVTEPRRGGGRSSSGITRHGAGPAPEPAEQRGYLVTSPARTVVDLARSRSFAAGVVAADHVLRAALCTRDELLLEVSRFDGLPDVGRARAVVAFADPRSESVGESLSRARIAELGLVVPDLQAAVHDERGLLIARVDFWWEAIRLVGEFDGRVKYRTSGVDDPRAVEERVWHEKRREDRIRGTGRGMVRWTWEIARNAVALHRLLVRAGVPRATR